MRTGAESFPSPAVRLALDMHVQPPPTRGAPFPWSQSELHRSVGRLHNDEEIRGMRSHGIAAI